MNLALRITDIVITYGRLRLSTNLLYDFVFHEALTARENSFGSVIHLGIITTYYLHVFW